MKGRLQVRGEMVEDVGRLLPEEVGTHKNGVDEDVVEEVASNGFMIQKSATTDTLACIFFIVIASCSPVVVLRVIWMPTIS
jgi:hypothetical protein